MLTHSYATILLGVVQYSMECIAIDLLISCEVRSIQKNQA